MLLFCLKCRENTESKNSQICKDKKRKNNFFYQNVKSVIVKNWNLSKNKKLVDY